MENFSCDGRATFCKIHPWLRADSAHSDMSRAATAGTAPNELASHTLQLPMYTHSVI